MRAAQPCRQFTPKAHDGIAVNVPVMRSIERMLEPSANAAITAIFLSVLSMLAM